MLPVSAVRFLREVFLSFYELHTLQFRNQRLQPVDFGSKAATRCESRRLYSAIWRMVSVASATVPAGGHSHEQVRCPYLTLQRVIYGFQRVPFVSGASVDALEKHGQLSRSKVNLSIRVTGQTKRPRSRRLVKRHSPHCQPTALLSGHPGVRGR